jgi:hypothetical protein
MVFAQAVDVAKPAERGRFDLLFLADSAAGSVNGTAESRGRMGKTVKEKRCNHYLSSQGVERRSPKPEVILGMGWLQLHA